MRVAACYLTGYDQTRQLRCALWKRFCCTAIYKHRSADHRGRAAIARSPLVIEHLHVSLDHVEPLASWLFGDCSGDFSEPLWLFSEPLWLFSRVNLHQRSAEQRRKLPALLTRLICRRLIAKDENTSSSNSNEAKIQFRF